MPAGGVREKIDSVTGREFSHALLAASDPHLTADASRSSIIRDSNMSPSVPKKLRLVDSGVVIKTRPRLKII